MKLSGNSRTRGAREQVTRLFLASDAMPAAPRQVRPARRSRRRLHQQAAAELGRFAHTITRAPPSAAAKAPQFGGTRTHDEDIAMA